MAERFDDSSSTQTHETGGDERRHVGYREALELARSAWDEEVYGGEIDYCCETNDAYLFSRSDYMSFGGPGPILVWKLGGGCGNYVACSLAGRHEIVKEGSLSEFE